MTENSPLAPKDYSKDYPSRNLLQLLENHREHPDTIASIHKSGGKWIETSWRTILTRVHAIAQGLADMGVKRGDRVAIFGDTSLEWLISAMGVWGAGAIAVPIYGSDTPEEIAFIVSDSGSCAVIVDSDQPGRRGEAGRLTRVRSAMKDMPCVKSVVVIDKSACTSTTSGGPETLSLADVESRGAESLKTSPSVYQRMSGLVEWNDTAEIVYTSGTTGRPKGVMLTHGNWVSQSYNASRSRNILEGEQLFLFLPLAHAFGMEAAAVWMGQNVTMSFAESIDTLMSDVKVVAPHVMPAVPRIFEKAFDRILATGRASDGFQKGAFEWAMGLFDQYVEARQAGRPFRSVQFALARRLVFGKLSQKVSELFGGRMRCFISGGAPLAPRIGYFFDLCGITICEGFGMTETSAPTHVNPDGRDGRGRNCIGTCGIAFPDVEVKFDADGELMIRGPQVMKGYYNMPEATAEVLSSDGWLRTGDIAELDDSGYLRITDRKKDLIKTSGGKYVAPAALENELKCCPLVGQVSIQGDCRKYITAIFTPDMEALEKFAATIGLSGRPTSEIVKDARVTAEVQKTVDELNARLPSYSTVKKFILLDHEWSQKTGEMTPTLKVKRRVVADRYKAQLDELYS